MPARHHITPIWPADVARCSVPLSGPVRPGRASTVLVMNPRYTVLIMTAVALAALAGCGAEDGAPSETAGASASPSVEDTPSAKVSAGGATRVRHMNNTRQSHTATLLADGRLLVTGGSDAFGASPTAEIYNPPTDTWTAIDTMRQARTIHTATLLPDGTVLVAGGEDSAGRLKRVELLDLAPTMLEAAGLEVPSRMQGNSLLPVLRGESDPSRIRERVYSEYYNSWTHKDAYGTMLRTETEKIVVYHGTDQGELYDLAADPDEFHNLWDVTEEKDRKLRLMKACFDASVLSMDPDPPRRGPF